MSQRRNKPRLAGPNEHRITKLEQQLAEVIASHERLQRQNEVLRKQNEALQKQVGLLQAEVEELKRAGKRQATPFACEALGGASETTGRGAKSGKGALCSAPNRA